MTTYYVGPGGNDANDGLSWANRFLTLNAAEDVPIAAADTVYVGAGVYREMLTVDVSGSAGNIITYIADVSGENTDGVGGIVRITGSDDDQSATRANCIASTAFTHRTFRGFMFDTVTSNDIFLDSPDTWIIEDCFFQVTRNLFVRGVNQANVTIRRCAFLGAGPFFNQIIFTHTGAVDDSGHLVENCLFFGSGQDGIQIDSIGGITIKNCTFLTARDDGVDVDTALTGGQTVTVNNCIFIGCSGSALEATAVGEIVEDYNTFYDNNTDRTNTNIGANSVTYPPLFEPQILLDGFKFPPAILGQLSEWSQVAGIAGSSEATDDLFGSTRPVTSAKKSWGSTQFVDSERDTSTVRTGTASIVLNDAGRVQMFVPVSNISTTISVYVNREGGYTGSNPQMIIKQPGQADRTTTDAGADSTWNQLTDTFTPAATPPYVIVELVSRNTASAGLYSNFKVYFDDLDVS